MDISPVSAVWEMGTGRLDWAGGASIGLGAPRLGWGRLQRQ